MTTQATANARSRRLLWLLAALATGLNGCSDEPFEQASDSVAGVSTPAPPTEDLVRSALTRAFREQARNAARITHADVTAELAERMEHDRGMLLAGTEPRKRGYGESAQKFAAAGSGACAGLYRPTQFGHVGDQSPPTADVTGRDGSVPSHGLRIPPRIPPYQGR